MKESNICTGISIGWGIVEFYNFISILFLLVYFFVSTRWFHIDFIEVYHGNWTLFFFPSSHPFILFPFLSVSQMKILSDPGEILSHCFSCFLFLWHKTDRGLLQPPLPGHHRLGREDVVQGPEAVDHTPFPVGKLKEQNGGVGSLSFYLQPANWSHPRKDLPSPITLIKRLPHRSAQRFVSLILLVDNHANYYLWVLSLSYYQSYWSLIGSWVELGFPMR